MNKQNYQCFDFCNSVGINYIVCLFVCLFFVHILCSYSEFLILLLTFKAGKDLTCYSFDLPPNMPSLVYSIHGQIK